MISRKLPRGLPRGAVAEPGEYTATSGTAFFLRKRLVARVYWHDNGAIERETHFDEDGRMHGTEREFHRNGKMAYRASWVHGRQHGWQEQWDERGRLVVRTRFHHGTGLDAWFTLGRLSETREYLDGTLHGFQRWWQDRRSIWAEAHYVGGREHGVFREWRDGKLRRGFPKFWVNGAQITRRAYVRAVATDVSLPRLDPRDDARRRKAPKVIEGLAARH